MTLIIGIKSSEGVILASDSQVTYGTGKRTDSTKMEVVAFDHFPVLVAQSGSVLMTNRFVDFFRMEAEGVAAQTPDQVGAIAQQAMRKLRADLRDLHFNCSSEELSEILRKEGTEAGIMLGFYMKKQPYLISINLNFATYQKSRFHYEADGCGAALGQYLLAEYSSPDMDAHTATMLAIYIIESVKKHDAYCGGPTRVAALREFDGNPSIVFFSPEKIEKCVGYLANADTLAKSERQKIFRDKLNSPKLREIGTVYSNEVVEL